MIGFIFIRLYKNRMNRIQCRICNEVGHSPSKCPCLTEDLKKGFYSGGGSGGGHSHDDDEGCCVEVLMNITLTPASWNICSDRAQLYRSLTKSGSGAITV